MHSRFHSILEQHTDITIINCTL